MDLSNAQMTYLLFGIFAAILVFALRSVIS